MITIFDVAKKAGVSVVTVSRLLNNPKIVSRRTAEKVFKVIEQLNYQPSQIARSLVSKKTNTIGVIMPDIKNTFFNSWFRFVEEYTALHHLNLLLCNTDEDVNQELKYVRLLHSQRVDGVIIAPHSKKSVEYLLKVRMRFILFDRIFNDMKTDFVTTDHYQGSFKAVEYLLSLGHKRIALLTGPGVLFADIQRSAAYVDALRKHKIKIEKSLMFNCEFKEEKAFQAVLDLMKGKDKPTAIFAISGLMTIGVIKAMRELDLSIPRDISLVGFDEISGQDIFQPQITHVAQPINELGKYAINALIHKIKNPNSSKHTRLFLQPELVVGDSCRRICSEERTVIGGGVNQ
jgi:LacI family transcriptional regulator